MVKRIGTSRRKTRHLFKKNYRSRGKLSVVKYLQEFSIGDRIALTLEPSVHEGMYFRRFHGRIGTVIGKRGSCYEVEIRDGGKKKIVITHPVHLKKV